MTFIPLPKERKDARTLIIEVLKERWPLSAKEVFREISKTNGKVVTYQGIHKALGQLEVEGVVCRSKENKNGFELNENWVSELKEMSDQLHLRKVKKMPSTIVDMVEGESRTFDFKNVAYVEPFFWMIGEVLKVCEMDKQPGSLIFHQSRVWPLTVVSNKEYDVLKKMLDGGDHYLLSASDELMDRFLVDLWKNLGVRCKLGVPCAGKAELVVFKDFIFQAFNNKQVLDWDQMIWDKSTKRGKPDIALLNKIYLEGEIDSKFVFTRNENLANLIRKETIAHFK